MSGIRLADIPDVKYIRELAKELWEQSVYSDVKPDEQKFNLSVANLIGTKRGQVYVVVDDNDKPQGFLLGVIDEWWFSRMRYATDMGTYIREGYRQYAASLYRAFIKWARTKPRVIEISFARSSGIGDGRRWEALMKRLGMSKMGSIYTMRVEPCPVS